ncbi:MAG: erythromycin esterase family protein [Sphingopyxis sp.]|uniref:erythromycin esterase family protein n=1 Tax=Sphingopyxis sp. TaxID=1908224 RepID=UPI003D6D70B3
MIDVRRIGLALSLLFWTVPAAAEPSTDAAFVGWARDHAIALPACSSISSGADYSAIANRIGGARLVALGEPVHGAHEPLALRNCLFRYLVETQGFTAIALESGLHESRRLSDYAAGGQGDVRDIARSGFTWGFWRFPENIELLEWIRAYNLDARHVRKIAFYGIDMSGGDADGAWARARVTLDDGIAYLARAAPAKSAPVRRKIAPFLARFSVPGYRALGKGERARLRQGIGDILGFFDLHRAALIGASSREDYDWARQNIVAARQLQALFDVSRDPGADAALMPDDYRADAARDAAMADNARWALGRIGPKGRMLLFAHNGHVMNGRTRGGLWSVYAQPPAAMGLHLRRAFGDDLLILGTSAPAGKSEAGAISGTVDAALASTGLAHFLIDIRSPDPAASAWLSREQSISVNYAAVNLIEPRQAFDALVFVSRLTPSGGTR